MVRMQRLPVGVLSQLKPTGEIGVRASRRLRDEPGDEGGKFRQMAAPTEFILHPGAGLSDEAGGPFAVE